ncbi:MAG: hypothetical protein B6I20_10625 [Bacteroidetes bacterium 4572_117]|nr:MAG: hypothetical protein B6I20_10625 [Bacteroidetes bacterium 4572_117]
MREIKRKQKFKRNISRRYSSERNISIGLKLKIWMSDVLTIIGGGFLLLGLPAMFAFIPFSSVFSPGFSDTDPIIEGKIIEVNRTGASINDQSVYEYVFAYNPPDGGNYEGVGYSTGCIYEVDAQVEIIYKRNQQEISKAKNLRTSSFPIWISFFVLIFPLVGAAMLYFSTKKAINAIYVLKIGEIAYGKFLNKEPTNTTVNKRRVYKYTFEFTAKDNKVYQAIAKTHLYERLEDEDVEKLVYDPDDPENAVLLDAFPLALRRFFANQ